MPIGGVIACGGGRHVTHHLGVDEPITGAEVVPVVDGFGTRAVVAEGEAGAALEGFAAEPVGPLVVDILADEGLMVVLD